MSMWATGVVGSPSLEFISLKQLPGFEYLLECCHPAGVVVPTLLPTTFERLPFDDGFYEVFAEVIPGEMSRVD